MAAQIKIVDEQEIGGSFAPASPPPISQAPPLDVLAALHALNGRLQAVEAAIQGVPKAVGLIRTLTRALGARALMFVAMIGCLGLASATAVSQSWEGVSIFAAFAILVYLPMAYLASKGN